jgi:hypothetical protein
MREIFYGVGVAALVGLAGGTMMKPDLAPALTRDGSMAPVEPAYDDQPASLIPATAPVYYDSWASYDQAALLQSASYDAGEGDPPRYDPRPSPEDRAEAIRLATLEDNLNAPPPETTSARYPSAEGDILVGLTPPAPIPPLPQAVPPVSQDGAAVGDTRTASPS